MRIDKTQRRGANKKFAQDVITHKTLVSTWNHQIRYNKSMGKKERYTLKIKEGFSIF